MTLDEIIEEDKDKILKLMEETKGRDAFCIGLDYMDEISKTMAKYETTKIGQRLWMRKYNLFPLLKNNPDYDNKMREKYIKTYLSCLKEIEVKYNGNN